MVFVVALKAKMAERKALQKYIELRAQYASPYSRQFDKAIQEHPRIKVLLKLDLLRSKMWVNNFWRDLGYHLLQAHPVSGFFSHHCHPQSFIDRCLVILGGVSCARCSKPTLCVHPGVHAGVCRSHAHRYDRRLGEPKGPAQQGRRATHFCLLCACSRRGVTR